MRARLACAVSPHAETVRAWLAVTAGGGRSRSFQVTRKQVPAIRTDSPCSGVPVGSQRRHDQDPSPARVIPTSGSPVSSWTSIAYERSAS